jgi:hypothetical protein
MCVALKDCVYCFSGLKEEQLETNRTSLHASSGRQVVVGTLKCIKCGCQCEVKRWKERV